MKEVVERPWSSTPVSFHSRFVSRGQKDDLQVTRRSRMIPKVFEIENV